MNIMLSNRFAKGLLYALAMLLLAVPALSYAQGLVPCGNSIQTVYQGDQICTVGECTTCDLLRLAQNIINFFVLISVVVATLLFVNAGVLYLGASANPGNVSRAHKIFINTVIGLIIVLASWLVIDVIMKTLAHQSGPYSGPWDGILCNAESNMNCVPVLEGITTTLVGDALPSGGVPQTPAPPPPAAPTGGIIGSGTRVTDAQARQIFSDHGFSVWESAPGATQFEGMREETVRGALRIAAACPTCDLTITGGTEAGYHAEGEGQTHANGYKIDLDDTPSLNNHIQNNWQPIGMRGSDPVYQEPLGGGQCVREATHWDCTYP